MGNACGELGSCCYDCVWVLCRLLHSPNLVDGEQSVGETMPSDATYKLDWGQLNFTALLVRCNALWGYMADGNSYQFPKATDSLLHSPNGRQICLPLGLCKETVE